MRNLCLCSRHVPIRQRYIYLCNWRSAGWWVGGWVVGGRGVLASPWRPKQNKHWSGISLKGKSRRPKPKSQPESGCSWCVFLWQPKPTHSPTLQLNHPSSNPSNTHSQTSNNNLLASRATHRAKCVACHCEWASKLWGGVDCFWLGAEFSAECIQGVLGKAKGRQRATTGTFTCGNDSLINLIMRSRLARVKTRNNQTTKLNPHASVGSNQMRPQVCNGSICYYPGGCSRIRGMLDKGCTFRLLVY